MTEELPRGLGRDALASDNFVLIAQEKFQLQVFL
jgi:hypothetical protein